MTERRKGLHIGNDGHKGTWKLLGIMCYVTASGKDRIETGSGEVKLLSVTRFRECRQ